MTTPAQGIHSGQPFHQSFQQNLNPQKTVDYLTGIGTSRPQETVDVDAIAQIEPIEGPTGNGLPVYAGPIGIFDVSGFPDWMDISFDQTFSDPHLTLMDGELGIFFSNCDQWC